MTGSGSPILDEGVTVDPDNLPSGQEKRRQVRSLFDTIAPRYDLVNRVMSFGLDVRWRKASMKKLDATAGSVIIDLACGTGDFCREIEKHGMVPVGLDLSMGMLAAARTGAPLVHADILAMPLADGSVDGATCGFALRNLIELEGFFDEVARVVRPGGRIAFLDASPPENPVLRFGHGIYFNRVVPVIGGLLSEGRAYAYLPKSVAYLPPWPELKAQMEAAGFVDVERKVFTGAHLFTATARSILMVGHGVHHVSLNVTDTAAAVAFYERLGFATIDRPDLGFPGAWLRIGDSGELHLLEFPPPEAKGQHFSVHVDDLDTAVATLATAGIEPDRIGGIDGVCRQAFLTDPSGNQVELTQPL